MYESILQAIGKQLDAYHDDHTTTSEFRVLIDNEDAKYFIQLATYAGMTFEFKSGAELAVWLADVVVDIHAPSSHAARQQLEQLTADKIRNEAKIEALTKEVGELPETQLILDAQAEAAETLRAARERLAGLEKAKESLVTKAALAEYEAAKAEAAATTEELAEAEALALIAKNAKGEDVTIETVQEPK